MFGGGLVCVNDDFVLCIGVCGLWFGRQAAIRSRDFVYGCPDKITWGAIGDGDWRLAISDDNGAACV